ncbi:MAG: FkbM family methyltransferase [Acetobacteraceae bacterium]|jgi:FkbM family methyltransferase
MLVSRLPDNCVVVDAGANIGLVAVPIAQAVLLRGGVVHAFEVQRMLCYALCGSAALNDLENLIVRNQALGSTIGTLGAGRPDYSRPQDFGAFSLIDQAGPHPDQGEVVPIDCLGLPRLDFLKVDVEGMEIEVLRGARSSIERYLPWGWVEYWNVNIDDIKAQFAGLGYKFYIMDRLNMLCAPADRLARLDIPITAREA